MCIQYIEINDVAEENCVEFERGNNKSLVFLLSNCPKVLTLFS